MCKFATRALSSEDAPKRTEYQEGEGLPKNMSSTTEAAPSGIHAGKYLTVALEKETYGMSVMKVREIIRMQKITPVPQMPAYVRGVINLRGRMIPIVDLRMKFGLKAEFADRTCIIVVQVKLPGNHAVPMGLIVDSVEEVVTLAATDIEPPPDFGANANIAYLLGMAKVKGQVKMLLDIDRVVAPETVRAIQPEAA
jgi:purine-binding chemotaxis protein CheW